MRSRVGVHDAACRIDENDARPQAIEGLRQ
jgi:hypothetical protein